MNTVHPRWQSQPATLAAQSPRYDAPRADAEATAWDVTLPGDGTVGVLTYQAPERLGFVTGGTATVPQAAILAELVRGELHSHALEHEPAAAACEAVLAMVPHGPARRVAAA